MMSTSRIKSQPAYPPLEWDRGGRQHIVFAAAEEPALARRLFEWPPLGETVVLSVQEAQSPAAGGWLAGLPSGVEPRSAPRLDAALQQLDHLLEHADMGARLYLVGDEDAIWQASRVADRWGMGADAVRRHRVGTQARPVYCVHCRAITRHVVTNIVECDGCGRALFVRDHFSRRLGAYMGFQVDAEAPGERPAVEEIYR